MFVVATIYAKHIPIHIDEFLEINECNGHISVISKHQNLYFYFRQE